MTKPQTSLFALAFATVVLISITLAAPPIELKQPLVTRGKDGSLNYSPDPDGYTLIDYSLCGYHSGKQKIPFVKVVKTLSPASGNGDDTARLQQAIDETKNGALLLKKGTYRVKGTLNIKNGNFVLRGEGNDAKTGTVIIATGTAERNLIVVTGSKSLTVTNKQQIVGNFLTGSTKFKVESASGFKVGDLVAAVKTVNNKWIQDLGMDKIPGRSDGGKVSAWDPKGYVVTYERHVKAVNGDVLTLDAGLPDSIQSKYGGGYIGKITQETSGVEEVGIENLRIVSEFKAGQIDKDEKHAVNAVVFSSVFNSWVADTVFEHFVHSGVVLTGRSKFNTIQDCANLDPASVITGGRRYAFDIEGDSCFNNFLRLYSTNGRHDLVTGAGVPGPNVFYNATIKQSHADIGPHHRWATGLLFDTIRSDGSFAAENRLNLGSGHGWSGASTVYWNVKAKQAQVCSPPVGANNYLVGVQYQTLKLAKPTVCNPGAIKDDKSAESIPSLYEAQLFQSTGKNSLQLFPPRQGKY